jgi:hypothetical protein
VTQLALPLLIGEECPRSRRVARALPAANDLDRYTIDGSSAAAASPFAFLLGVHKTSFLTDPRMVDVPFLISRRVLETGKGEVRKNLPPAPAFYAIDGGGFTELQMFGGWSLDERTYVARIRRILDAFGRGRLLWVAPQDWMCEPIVRSGGVVRQGKRVTRFRGTRLSLEAHQILTVQNFLKLRDLAPDLPWLPVLQGWEHDDYFRCIELYLAHGVDLFAAPMVGLGSVCRRQDTEAAERLVEELFYLGLRLHGFGMKIKGLELYHRGLASSDSLAWSEHARRRPALEGHRLPGFRRPKGHKNCASCLEYALRWRDKLLAALVAREEAFLHAEAEYDEAA